MKQCFKCKKEKPLVDFYSHSQMTDGYLNKCKECTKLDVRKHRAENLEETRLYDKKRARLPHRVVLNIESTKHSRKRSGYTSAHSAVARAIRNGDLKRMPCQMCGSELGVHAHHDDYSQPFNVMWLCVVHHKARHAYLNYVKAAIAKEELSYGT